MKLKDISNTMELQLNLASLIVLLTYISCNHGYQILLVTNGPSSHIYQLSMAGEELAQRGHEVYMSLPKGYSKKLLTPSVKPLVYRKPESQEILNSSEITKIHTKNLFSDVGFGNTEKHWIDLNFALCEYQLTDVVFVMVKAMQFDFAIVDRFYLGPCDYIFPHNLSIPFATFGAMLYPWLARTPTFPSFYPLFDSKISDRMTFKERLWTFYAHVAYRLQHNWNYGWNTSLLERYAPGVSSWEELENKAVLHFQTRDPLLTAPHPTPAVMATLR